MTDSKKRAKPLVVAVDGPAGSGKSSVCSEVAKRVGWTYLNTGAIYRAIGLLIKEAGVDLTDELAVADKARELSVGLSWDDETNELYFGDERLGKRLYSAQASQGASAIAKLPLLREVVLPLQRDLISSTAKGVIVDGRDIGTVVFPDAELKVFLTASLEERARRRLNQVNTDVDLETIKSEISARDEQDSARQSSPLKVAEDAEVLDTSDMDREATIEKLLELMSARQLL